MLVDPFSSPDALLRRARKHINELEREASIYANRKPYSLVVNDDLGRSQGSLKVKVDPIPVDLGCIAFDAISCMRSAMDHAVFAATKFLANAEFDPKSVKFPFGDSLEGARGQFRRRGGRGAANVPHELHDFLLSFKPYKGGDNTLWGFNEIRNENIHRVLFPSAVTSRVGIGGNGRIGEIYIVNKWDAAKSELTVAHTRNVDHGIKLEIAIEIAFTESSALPRKPVIGTLNAIADRTKDIVTGLRDESYRLLRER